jgi:Calcineurin-like phosphoesterase
MNRQSFAASTTITLLFLLLIGAGCSSNLDDGSAGPVGPPEKAGAAPLLFISDVQIDITRDNTAAEALSAIIAGRHVYDAGDLVEHRPRALLKEDGLETVPVQEYNTYRGLFPNSSPVPGNHDSLLGLPLWGWPTLVNEYNAGIHVVGFNTGVASTEQQWLADAVDDEDLTILYLHHQLYSDNDRVGNAADTYQPIIGAIAAQAELVISGHGHAYEHHLVDGTHYLVIGGGGAPLDTVGTSDTQVMSESVHHYVEVKPIREGVVLVTAKRLDGTNIESFIVSMVPKVIDYPDPHETPGLP